MRHYSIEQWAAFARGAAGEQRARMEEHLATGCARCRRVVELLTVVLDSPDRVEVPDAVVSRARAIFPAAAFRRESPLRRIVAALRFDSYAALAPAGVRGGPHGPRRLAFGAEDIQVELLVEPAATPRAVAVTGQISGGPGTTHRVRLMARRTVVAETGAETSGEFHIEFPRRRGLRLLIAEETSRREIEVPLDPILGSPKAPGLSGSKSD